ncbi:MAG: uroporphyrinogen decarboxylase family protein [Eubacteriales bacterium]|nr:uroporphyrinogen decarboxylase family protein [Eubacteriales bacterium]
MMTLRENAMAIYEHRQPDFYGDIMEAIELVPDPLLMECLIPPDGLPHKDAWGVSWILKEGAPGQHPHITDENKVIKDIEKWEEYVKVPGFDHLDWSLAEQVTASVDRREKMVGFMCAGGLFERSHFLMGIEDALCAYLENPDEMKALLRVIADYKITYIRLVAEKLHPDIIFYHDDWGSKQNVFLPPRVWREIIKPLQKEIADTIHACGMLYMHHADCICQPIVEDMVEIGVDIWQGVIAQNDIVKIQEVTKGKLAMVGGIDGPAIDISNITEEEIRQEVRRAVDTYCPAGRFFPGIPNGECFLKWNDGIWRDELKKYGRQYAIEHPIKENS